MLAFRQAGLYQSVFRVVGRCWGNCMRNEHVVSAQCCILSVLSGVSLHMVCVGDVLDQTTLQQHVLSELK